MKWIKKYYRLYMEGAKENDFPISVYGLFPSPSKAREIHKKRKSLSSLSE